MFFISYFVQPFFCNIYWKLLENQLSCICWWAFSQCPSSQVYEKRIFPSLIFFRNWTSIVNVQSKFSGWFPAFSQVVQFARHFTFRAFKFAGLSGLLLFRRCALLLHTFDVPNRASLDSCIDFVIVEKDFSFKRFCFLWLYRCAGIFDEDQNLRWRFQTIFWKKIFKTPKLVGKTCIGKENHPTFCFFFTLFLPIAWSAKSARSKILSRQIVPNLSLIRLI